MTASDKFHAFRNAYMEYVEAKAHRDTMRKKLQQADEALVASEENFADVAESTGAAGKTIHLTNENGMGVVRVKVEKIQGNVYINSKGFARDRHAFTDDGEV